MKVWNMERRCTMNENKEINCGQITKWLRVMIYVAIVSFVNAIVNILPFIPASITTWISRGIIVAMVVCMYQLSSVNEGYQKAWIMRASMLACNLITTFLWAFSFLTLAASIFSIIAVYREYNAHSELIAEKDSKLSSKWHSLFMWSILAGVLVGFGSVATVLIVTMAGMDAVKITALVVGLLGIPQMILDVVYITYLKKMIDSLSENIEGERI